ncbi:hypothetical protein [Mangrovibacter plantisponsor]|uniref:Pyrroline-5-carboxylate reductase catalytic N-terminal domain-containing protein n=1 Tax=Mangrovibacter plantisponsor TaxID=451513 RepID=A0A317Q8J5_9ENTR|nr:hypothetical protein [Mangrovibacter plantisponsor]PWW10656.1 hypothetical protein DES37_10326 [Mangrovibacter plantisponsor]
MTRIGILGINNLTESFLVELFRLDPCAHVFLSAGDSEQVSQLARKFPCWVQDNCQSVVDEADTLIISLQKISSDNIQENIKYRQTQLVLLLDTTPSFNKENIPSKAESFIQQHVVLHNVSPCFHLTSEQIDNYLFVLRVQLTSIKVTHSLEINIQTLSESATPKI